jgi:hypothetical protein
MPQNEASHPVWNSKIVLALIPILFGIVLFVVERNISDASASGLHIWLQFVTTNWPNWPGSFDRSSVWFALAVSIRVALADSLVAGIWVTFTRMVAWNREHTIRYADALRLRDHAIETELLNLLPAEARTQGLAGVRKAFEDASRVWEDEHLPTMLGPDLAKEFIRHLHEQEIRR